MANDWIKIRAGLHSSVRVHRISRRLGLTSSDVFVRLYAIASWFSSHGKYGRMHGETNLVDAITETPGLAEAMISEGLLRNENGYMELRWFASVGTGRTGLGAKLRDDVLSPGRCMACGTTSAAFVVDHIVPISRGGTSERENLQPLCVSCNSRKGTKTMEEFSRDNRP